MYSLLYAAELATAALPPPDKANYTLTFLALGDWGPTDDPLRDSVTDGKGTGNPRAFYAQDNIAKAMSAWARVHHPAFVLNHGDAFYWTGVTDLADHRWNTLFEQVYSDPSLFIPWYGVLGNHDYGGGSGICGPSAWNAGVLCNNPDELAAALNKKFDTQASYKSPHNNRWQIPAHYFTAKHEDPQGKFSIEIFNFESNAAGNRAVEICCQCYNTGQKDPRKDCLNPARGADNCIHGKVDQFDRCMGILNGWFDASMNALHNDITRSTATWKIVHNHYLFKFYTPEQQGRIRQSLNDGHAHIFIGGHEHAEGHDLLEGVHHIQNGGGGGAVAAGGTGNLWCNMTFGFVAARASAEWVQLLFYSDQGHLMHCYYLAVDHSDVADPHRYFCSQEERARMAINIQ